MMKKAILLIVILGFTAGITWGVGTSELTLNEKTSFGMKSYSLTVKYTYYRGYSLYGPSLYKPSEYGWLLDIVKKSHFIVEDEKQIPETVKSIKFYNDSRKFYKGSVKITNEQMTGKKLSIDNDPRSFKAFNANALGYSEQNVRFLILLNRLDDVTKTTWDFVYLEGDVFLEFYQGEELLFDKFLDTDIFNEVVHIAGKTSAGSDPVNVVLTKEQIYRLKSLCLLYIFIFYNESGFLEIGDFLLKDLKYSDGTRFYFSEIRFSRLKERVNQIYEQLFTGLKYSSTTNMQIETLESISIAIRNLKETINRNFSFLKQEINNNTIYYSDINQGSFESVYGPLSKTIAGSGRNIYIAAYMLFCFNRQKPLLSFLNGYELADKDIKYNYKDYTPISSEQGESLAGNALKYLNWGVEYTPYPVAESLQVYPFNKNIFQKNKAAVRQWIGIDQLSADRSSGTRSDNYFPGLTAWNGVIPAGKIGFDAFSTGVVIPSEHCYQNIDELYSITFGAYLSNTYELSRIDLWSANNIAWQENSIKTITANSSTSNLVSDMKRSGNTTLNQSADKSLSAGYVFNNTQDINALLLIGKMESEDASGKYSHKIYLKNNTETMELEKDPYAGASMNLLNFLAADIASKKLSAKDNKLGTWVTVSSSYENEFDEAAPSGKVIHYYSGLVYAFDGKKDKGEYFWSSGTNKTATMTVNLKEPQPVECIKIYWRRGADAHFDVFIGGTTEKQDEKIIDDSTFSIVAPNYNYKDKITVANVNKKIASFKIDVTASTSGVSILEIEVIRMNTFYREIVAGSDGTLKQLAPGEEAGNDSEVKYRYYIFNKKYTGISEARIVFNGVKKIQTEEILVFDNDPLSHLLQGNMYVSSQEGVQKSLFSNTDISGGRKYSGLGNTDDAKQKLKIYQDKNLTVETGEIDIKKYFEVYDNPVTVTNGANTDVVYQIRFPEKQLEGYCRYSTSSADSGTTRFFNIDPKKMMLSLSVGNCSRIKTVVLWDKKGSASLSSVPVLFTGNRTYLKDIFIKGTEEVLKLTDVLPDIQTPYFRIEKNVTEKMFGNPLPYAPFGIDSPRTFAYKMFQQHAARQWYRTKYKALYEKDADIYTSADSLLAVNNAENQAENYADSYISEPEIFKILEHQVYIDMRSSPPRYLNYSVPESLDKNVRPFLPGYYFSAGSNVAAGSADSPYQPDKVAGTDSLGLLAGAASMSGINLFNIFNVNIPENLDAYYRFSSNLACMDTDGKPVFYTGTTKSILNCNLNLTQADIEKCSIIVPDISMIRKGDIIVRNNDNGTPHIGIIVGYAWEKLAESVKPVYGVDAKTLYDKVYILSIRPGLQHVVLGTWGNSLNNIFGGFTDQPEKYHIRRLLTTGKPAAELTEFEGLEQWECVTKIKTGNYSEYPKDEHVPFDYYNTVSSAEVKADVKNAIKEIKTKNKNFYIEIPGTQYNGKDAKSVYGDGKMYVSSTTGWRHFAGYGMSYHFAIDIGGGLMQDILAPEDGYFYYFNNDADDSLIPLEGSTVINTKNVTYKRSIYGQIIVFVTDKTDLTRSRVYIFCHIGNPGAAYNDTKKVLDGFFTGGIPVGFQNARKVRQGELIGKVGNNGESTGAHIHLEIFEWFDKIDSGISGWRRINPLSVFPEKYFGAISYENIELRDAVIDGKSAFSDDEKRFFFKTLGDGMNYRP